jgi:hypothetical protein
MLVDGGERRQAEAPANLLEAGRVAVLLDELVQVVQDFALAFGKREHGVSSCNALPAAQAGGRGAPRQSS